LKDSFQIFEQELISFFYSPSRGALGELIGGSFSDWWQRKGWKKEPLDHSVAPEHRLWLAYPGLALGLAGLVIFCITLDEAMHWNIRPVIGLAVVAFGFQIATTVIFTCKAHESIGNHLYSHPPFLC
jgi:hypothetical protein